MFQFTIKINGKEQTFAYSKLDDGRLYCKIEDDKAINFTDDITGDIYAKNVTELKKLIAAFYAEHSKKERAPKGSLQREISVRINGTMKKFKYSVRSSDGRFVYNVPDGINGYKDDGTAIYHYIPIYGRTELELKQNIAKHYDEEERAKLESEIFAMDILNWLKLSKFAKIRGTTYDRYEQVIKYQIMPEAQKLKHKSVKEITVEDCKTILNNISENNSVSTSKKAKYLMRKYFHEKFSTGDIDRDIMDFDSHDKIVENYANDNDEDDGDNDEDDDIDIADNDIVYLEDDEIEKVKNICYNGYDLIGKTPSVVKKNGITYACNNQHEKITHNYVPQAEFFIFMMNTGLRAGEAVSLKYCDIDFERHFMTVRRNVRYIKKRDKNGNATGGRMKKKGQPKTTGSKAKVKINNKAIEILKKMRENEPDGYNGYILHETRNGCEKKPLSPNALYKRWQTVCKYAGIEPKGLHCLRHTCASQMFAATNGNIKAVSTLLRHKDEAFTMRVYVDMIKKYQDIISEEFEV